MVPSPASRVSIVLGGAAFVFCSSSISSSALAGDFDARGVFHFASDAAVTIDFSQPVPVDAVTDTPDEEDAPLPTRAASDTALVGGQVWLLEPSGSAEVALPIPATARRYRASVWLRHGEGSAFVALTHAGETHRAEVATLYPTGRVTSDGWVELANEALAVDGERSEVTLGVYCPGGCEVDAAELRAEGPVERPLNRPCAGAVGAAVCGVGQVCMWSECRNVSGWVPPIPRDRDDVRRYLRNRLSFLFGPYLERELDLPASLATLDQMVSATDPWSYWNSFMLAVRRLHDGHTVSRGLSLSRGHNPRPIHVCFFEGDADLTHATAASDASYHDVLVSHVGGDHTLGLRSGDRLVRVDGQHPIAWARSLIEVNWRQPVVSNHHTFAEHASELGTLISTYADTIEVIRCNPVAQTCGALEAIDVGALPLEAPPRDAPDAPVTSVACDNRPWRHLPGAPDDHKGERYEVSFGIVDASDDSERIYGIEWDSLFATSAGEGVGEALAAAVATAKESARGLVLDHRRGVGGTFAGPAVLWDFAVARKPLSIMVQRQQADAPAPSLEEGRAIFDAAVADDTVLYAGGRAPATMPVALLLTQDVSASDWLPLGMKGSPNVRLFAPYQTNGGFSTRYILSYWLGMTYVMASSDTFVADGRAINGTGVEPDVVVLPRQSDLLAGRDTLFEAALAWIRQEMAP